MVMTSLQFTLPSFLTLFTRLLTRHDSMLMSRNDSNQSKSNDSYDCFLFFEPRLFKSTLLCSLNLCYLVGVSLSLPSQMELLDKHLRVNLRRETNQYDDGQYVRRLRLGG